MYDGTGDRTWRTTGQEERFFDLSIDLLAIVSADDLVWQRVNPAFEQVLGWDREDLVGCPVAAIVHPDDVDRSATNATALRRGDHRTAFENRLRCRDGTYRWIAWTTVVPADDALLFSIGRDVTQARELAAALRANEARLRHLVAELQHRVRNVLAVVRAVFGRTVETSPTREDLVSHFTGRLDALARTQVIASDSVAQAVDLEDLIRDELLSVGLSDGPQLRIAGPSVHLPTDAAEMVGLALHELTTNALKYGALSRRSGTLTIGWAVSGTPGGSQTLTIDWEERGVPALPLDPLRRGFGRELIEDGLPYRLNAETRLVFQGGGLRCTIALPLAAAMAIAAEG